MTTSPASYTIYITPNDRGTFQVVSKYVSIQGSMEQLIAMYRPGVIFQEVNLIQARALLLNRDI